MIDFVVVSKIISIINYLYRLIVEPLLMVFSPLSCEYEQEHLKTEKRIKKNTHANITPLGVTGCCLGFRLLNVLKFRLLLT